MSACSSCNPCNSQCDSQCCNSTCLRWGFDGCYLRGRCPDGTELEPLNLCNWLHTHETCTELKLVPQTNSTGNGGYLSYTNECDEEYKFWICDFFGLGNLECINNVYDRTDPANCDLLVYNPNCSTDPDNPTYNKWTHYHIPDATTTVDPDNDGYYKVLTKNTCGCIEEKKLFAQSTTWEYSLRDSWPDDPDWPFTYGSLTGNDTEIIDIQLDQKIPMWNKTDLEVTIQYAYGIQNHSYSTRRNYKSTVTPTSVSTHTPSLSDQYSKSIVLQGCNLAPWGSWEWQASRTFIIPKGQKLYLTHEILVHDIDGNVVAAGDTTGSSRLHALHVFVRATKGSQV